MAPSHVRTADEVSNPTNPVVGLADDVSAAFRRNGYDVPTWSETLQTAANDSLADDSWVIPDFMTDGTGTAGAIRDGRSGLDFTLRASREGEANSEGRSLFTAAAVRENWSVDDVVDHLAETGQIDVAAEQLDSITRADVNPIHVVCWAIATYLKGVVAERILTKTDRFSKAGVSNDQAGDDVYDLQDDGRLKQVKCVTHDTQKDDHIYYQFDCDGRLWYGDDCNDVAAAAVEASDRVGDSRKAGVDIPSTVVRRTHTSYKEESRPHVKYDSATYRYIGW